LGTAIKQSHMDEFRRAQALHFPPDTGLMFAANEVEVQCLCGPQKRKAFLPSGVRSTSVSLIT
jgi:hypothetical protein